MREATVTAERQTTTEADLFAGYRGLMRTEPCVCGGEITASNDDWHEIAAALRLHYLSLVHQAYRTSVEEPAA